MTTALAPIVVGVDGSDASLAALRWAVAEAEAHGAPLCVVHVLDPREHCRAPYAQAAAWDTDPSDRAAADEAQIEQGLPYGVRRVFERGNPVRVLLRFAVGARTLVLGHASRDSRRDGEGFRHGPALGSIARACVAEATCPVVVVPLASQWAAPGIAELEPQRESTFAGSQPEGVRALYPRMRATPVFRR